MELRVLDKIHDDPEFREFLWAIGTAHQMGVCGEDLWCAVQEFVKKEWGIELHDILEVTHDVDAKSDEWYDNLPHCCPRMEINEEGICTRCGAKIEQIPGLKEAWDKGPSA